MDIIYGGVKINTLPTKVAVEIKNRASFESSLEEVIAKILNLGLQIGKEKSSQV